MNAFEIWAEGEGFNIRRDGNDIYFSSETVCANHAWSAAEATLRKTHAAELQKLENEITACKANLAWIVENVEDEHYSNRYDRAGIAEDARARLFSWRVVDAYELEALERVMNKQTSTDR
jgi:hypothetical protein